MCSCSRSPLTTHASPPPSPFGMSPTSAMDRLRRPPRRLSLLRARSTWMRASPRRRRRDGRGHPKAWPGRCQRVGGTPRGPRRWSGRSGPKPRGRAGRPRAVGSETGTRLVPRLGWPALRTNGVLQPQLARRPLNPPVFAARSAPLDAHPHAPNSFALSGAFTRSVQSTGHSTGQGDMMALIASFPCILAHRPLQRQCSARATNPTPTAFRSMYRETVNKQMFVALHREALEPSLIQMTVPDGPVRDPPTHRMRVCQPTEEDRQRPSPGRLRPARRRSASGWTRRSEDRMRIECRWCARS